MVGSEGSVTRVLVCSLRGTSIVPCCSKSVKKRPTAQNSQDQPSTFTNAHLETQLPAILPNIKHNHDYRRTNLKRKRPTTSGRSRTRQGGSDDVLQFATQTSPQRFGTRRRQMQAVEV